MTFSLFIEDKRFSVFKIYLTSDLTFVVFKGVVCNQIISTFAPSLKKIVFHKFVWFRLVVSKCLRVGFPALSFFYFAFSFFYLRCSLSVFFRRFAFLPLLLSVFL